jgi:predicted nuclease with TOPRIM domain
MTFWALLTLILLLSALVAYLGDRVAKWAGKRHFRFLGLRPRQTATLVAVMTGVGIALFSYLGFLLVFREARETILEAQAIREERDRLKGEREALLRAKEAMEAEAARALSELNALRAERKELLKALEEAEALKGRLMAEARGLQAQVAALGKEKARLEEEKARLEEEKTRLAALLSEREALLAEKERALAERTEALKALEEALRKTAAEKKRLEGEKGRLEADLALLQARLEEARRERQGLEEELSALRGRLAEAQRSLAQAEERVRDLLRQAEALAGERGQLSERLLRLSQGLYLGEVRLGAEEGRATLERVAERRALLQGFRGAELLEGEVRGPGLAVLEGAGYRDGRLLVRFRFYPEKKAFAAGEVLASATFRLSTQARHQEVLERLGEEARRRLLEAGFPPEYATFPSPEELARGLALLQGRKGVVRLGVVAAKDLWTTERPLLAYQLLGGPPGPEVPLPTQKVP